jgi:hypothetical protein
MVHKYPSNLKELRQKCDKVPISEITFYKMLDDLSEEWYVWHSVEWADDLLKESGEADFIVFHPQKGFVIIEVKGGLISTHGRNFYTTNTMTNEKVLLKQSPFEQAKQTMYFLRNFYVEKANKEKNKKDLLKKNSHGYEFPLSFSFGVFFPDSRVKDNSYSLSFSPSLIFDNTDLEEQGEWKKFGKIGLSPLEDFLTALLDRHQDKRADKPKAANYFKNLITPKLNTYITRKHYINERSRELKRVNNYQDYLIDALSQKRKCLFQGSAGSGKTFIAMKKTLENYRKGLNTLVLCYNRELRDSIEQYFCSELKSTYDEFQDKITVNTFHQFCFSIGAKLFEGDEMQRFFKLIRRFQLKKACNVLSAHKNNLPKKIPEDQKYDAILIDEAQDIETNFYPYFRYFLRDESQGLFYLFFDTSQDIYGDNFDNFPFGLDPHRDLITLNQNLRNTVEIAKWIQKETNLGQYEKFSGINGFKIGISHYESGERALKTAIAVINEHYYRHGISPDQVLILSTNSLDKILPKAYSQLNSHYYQYNFKYTDTDSVFFILEPHRFAILDQLKAALHMNGDPYALFKTIHSFKGLERDIVFLLVNKNSPELEKLLYVGASRAKFKLHVFYY